MALRKLLCALTLPLTITLCARIAAQVQTEVPEIVACAKPVAVERKIQGRALKGNLEEDAVDRDVSVFLAPSYAKETSRRYT